MATTTTATQPARPIPSTDHGVVPPIQDLSLSENDPSSSDLPTAEALSNPFSVDPIAALRLLARTVQALSDLTGDVPATPPPYSRPTTPSLHSRTTSSTNLATLRTPSRPGTPPSRVPSDDLHAPTFKPVAIGTPESEGEDSEAAPGTLSPAPPLRPIPAPISASDLLLSRKFFSKKPPPIPVSEYLLRLHRYCPMSTAVYLTAAFYVSALALDARVVPVTPRTAHRLLLGTLRVAMKALEDLSYPHRRFAGVGGVAEPELARLELAVCYLLDFDLQVSLDALADRSKGLLAVAAGPAGGAIGVATLRASLGGHRPVAASAMPLRLPGRGDEGVAGRRVMAH